MSSCCSQNHSLFSLSKLNDQFRIIFWTVCLLYEPNFPSYMFVNRIYNKMISISLLLSQGSHSVWLKRRSKKTVNKPKAELGLSHTCSNRALNPQQSDGGANSARNKGHTYSKRARNKGHTTLRALEIRDIPTLRALEIRDIPTWSEVKKLF